MKVTASEFQRNFGHFKELAQREPVTITSNGRESVVLISAHDHAEYLTLKQEFYALSGKTTPFEQAVNQAVQEVIKANEVSLKK
jgi:prevent-host-death family protein